MRLIPLFSAAFGLLALPAFAQVEPYPTREAPGRSVQDLPAPVATEVFRSPTYLTLHTGVFSFDEPDGSDASRLATSLIFDWNFQPEGPVATPIQYGLQSGLVFSYLGSPGAGFFGAGGDTPTDSNDEGSLFILPINLWGGYHFQNADMLLSLHTGANFYFATDEDVIALGRDNDGQGGEAEIYPNLGIRVGWDTGENFALMFRTDFTLAPNNTNFLGMIGATIPLA